MAKPLKLSESSAASRPSRGRRAAKDTTPYVKLFKALADANRLRMLSMIAAAAPTELCVYEIETHFELSQPTISHHLKLLREAGLLSGERRGTWVYYRLTPKTLDLLPAFVKLLTNRP